MFVGQSSDKYYILIMVIANEILTNNYIITINNIILLLSLDINTSLARLDYEYYSVDVTLAGLDALWQNKTVEIISEPIQAGKHSW